NSGARRSVSTRASRRACRRGCCLEKRLQRLLAVAALGPRGVKADPGRSSELRDGHGAIAVLHDGTPGRLPGLGRRRLQRLDDFLGGHGMNSFSNSFTALQNVRFTFSLICTKKPGSLDRLGIVA